MSVTVSEAGAFLFLLFVIFYWLRIFAVVTAVSGFVAVVLLGTSGWLGRILADVAGWAERLVGTVTADVIGTSLGAGLFIVLAIVFVHDLHPRNQTGKRTAWAGVALGALVIAGVTGIPALSGLHSAITSAASSVISIL